MEYIVKEVSSQKEFKDFCQFQHRLYSSVPTFVPTLDRCQRKALSESPSQKYCAHKLLLAYDSKGNVAGRCCAMVNLRYNILYNTKKMQFGWTDFVEDYDAFKALMDSAVEWGRSQGATEIFGPFEHNSVIREGVLVEGFANMTQAFASFNPPYYARFVERYGFKKDVDLVQYRISGLSGVPDSLPDMSRRVLEETNMKIVGWSWLLRHKSLAAECFSALSQSLLGNHDFVPLTDAELSDFMRAARFFVLSGLSFALIDPNGHIAALAMASADLSSALKKADGSLSLFDKFRIVRSQLKFQDVDFFLVWTAPEYDKEGLSAVCYNRLVESLRDKDVRHCITRPIYEDEPSAKVWDSYIGKELYSRRRLYRMSI